MKPRFLPALCVALFLVAALNDSTAIAQDSVVVWRNFDAETFAFPDAENCTVARSTAAAAGEGCLAITMPDPMEKVAQVTFPLPEGLDPSTMHALRFRLRTTPEEDSVTLRWYAQTGDGDTIFQRRFGFDQGAVWTQLDLPLQLWRWDNRRVGKWSEVKQLALRIETRVIEVRVDELEWIKGTLGEHSACAEPELYDEIAFQDKKMRAMERDGYRIATDALDKVNAQDIDRVFERFTPIPLWLERVFGDAVRPVSESRPIPIIVFSTREDYTGFFERLGTAWRVGITPPGAGGYAIQDIAASFYDDKLGMDRPVFFHEAVHATAARYLRLLPGCPAHSWLQEGLANYLQLCLFPESLKLDTYPRLFKEGVDAGTYFLPLEKLLTGRIGMKHYAQLASLTAWMVNEKPDWLPVIAKGIADGEDLADVLKGLDTSYAGMQEDWLEWGRNEFKPDVEREHHFELPQEWVKDNPEAPNQED